MTSNTTPHFGKLWIEVGFSGLLTVYLIVCYCDEATPGAWSVIVTPN